MSYIMSILQESKAWDLIRGKNLNYLYLQRRPIIVSNFLVSAIKKFSYLIVFRGHLGFETLLEKKIEHRGQKALIH